MSAICATKAKLDGSKTLPQSPTGAADGGAKGIETILRRARQIHREHGGLFGYDFDDWIEAWQRPE
jgi:hypothetical protein